MQKKSTGLMLAGAFLAACLTFLGATAAGPQKTLSLDEGVLSDPAGLMWVDGGNFARLVGLDEDGLVSWPQALRLVEAMNSGEMPNFGYNDWRLPSESEFRRLQLAGLAGPTGKAPKTLDYWLERSIASDPSPVEFENAAALSDLDRQNGLGMVLPVRSMSLDPGFSDVVIFASNSVWLQRGSQVLSGDVAANEVSPGPFLNSEVELSISQNVVTSADSRLIADSIKIAQGAMVGPDVVCNELDNSGSPAGLVCTPFGAGPFFSSIPPFQSGIPGLADVEVGKNRTALLAVGDYRDVTVAKGGSLTFLGDGNTSNVDIYNLRLLDAKNDTSLEFLEASQVRIEETLLTGMNSFIGPAAMGLDAAQIIFYVAGDKHEAAEIGQNNLVQANLFVANSTLFLQQGTVATGGFFARDVRIGKDVEVSFDSTFGNSPPTDILLSNDMVDENSPIGTVIGTLSAVDPDLGDTFTFTEIADPDNKFSVMGTDLKVDGALDFESQTSHNVTIRVTDSGGLTFDKMFIITVKDVNEAPTANPQMVMTDEDVALGIILTGSDPDGGMLTFTIVPASGPSNGMLSGAPPSLTYTPDDDFNGMDSFDFKVQDPGGLMDTATVEITVKALNDAPEAGAIGPISVHTHIRRSIFDGAEDLLSNSTDVDLGSTLAVNSVDALSTNGGTVVLTNAALGEFSYNPPADFTGLDSFGFEVCDDGMDNGNALTPLCDTGTATVNVAGAKIWFVDATAPGGGLGRLTDPFNELAGGGGTSYDANASDDPGDIIFIDNTGGSDTYVAGLTLLDGQQLIGKGVSGAGFDSELGITPPAGSDARPSVNGAHPTLTATTDAITLGMNNTIRGLIVDDTTSVAIAGTNVGTVTVDEVSVTGDGGALDVDTGTLAFSFDEVSVANTSDVGIRLLSVDGSLDVTTGSISNDSSPAVEIAGTAGGVALGVTLTGISSANSSGVGLSIDLTSGSFSVTGNSSITSSAGRGVSLSNSNAAAFSFVGLDISSNDTALFADSAGSLSVSGASNSLSATGGAAADINDTVLDVIAQTLDTTDSPDHGLSLSNVSGTQFTVTGNTTIDMAAGSNEGINVVASTLTNLSISAAAAVNVNDRRASGIFLDTVSNAAGFGAATIPNPNGAGGYGIRMEDSSGSVTFASATISNTVQNIATADAGNDGVPDNEGDGDAIFLKDNGGSFTLNGGTLGPLASDGIDIRDAGNLTLSGVTIEDIGTASANPPTIPDAGIWARNLSGTSLIVNTVIRRAQSDNFDEHIRIKNADTSISELRLNNVDISNTTAGSVGDIRGANGFLFEAAGNMDATVIVENGSDATGIRLVAWDFLIGNGSGGSGTINVVVDDSEMDPNGLTVFSGGAVVVGVANDLQIGIQDSYAVNYNFVNNFIHDVQLGLTAAGVISNNSTGSATVNGRIVGNQITDIRGRRGVNLIAQSSLSGYSLTVDDNDINDLAEETVMGTNLFAAEALGMQVIGSVSGAQLRVLNNRLGTVTPVGNGNLQEGVFLQTGQTASADILVFGNTVVGGNSGSEAVECDIEDTSNVSLSFNSNTLTAEPDDATEEVFVADTEDAGSTLCVDLDNNVATITTQEYELDENGVGAITLEDVATDNTGALNIDPGVTTGGADCARPSGVILASTGRISQLAAVSTAFQALEVTVKDDEGMPTSGVTVTFTAPGAGASGTFPSGNTCITDAMGQCSVPFTATATAGAYQVTAAAAGFEGAIFYLRNRP